MEPVSYDLRLNGSVLSRPARSALTFNPGRLIVWLLSIRFPYAFHTVQATVNRSGIRLQPRMPDSIGRRAYQIPASSRSSSASSMASQRAICSSATYSSGR